MGLTVLILWFRKGKRQYDGQVILLYFLWYGLGRAWIEGLRTDSLYIGHTGIRVSQALSLALVIFAATVLSWQKSRPHPRQELYVCQAAEHGAAKEEQAEGGKT